MTFTICFIIPAPSAHSRSPAPPTPHEVVADIVVHVLHLKLFKRLPEHAKPHCRCRTKLAHFKPNNTRIVTMSTISAVPSGPLTVQAADSHRKCQTINYIWLRLISNPVLYPPPSLCPLLLPCLGTLSTAHTRHANDQIQQIWDSVRQWQMEFLLIKQLSAAALTPLSQTLWSPLSSSVFICSFWQRFVGVCWVFGVN